MKDYSSGVWDVIATPAWMATTGLPLLVTLLGLVVGYLLFRRQMVSDKRLRRADHRREAARGLSSALTRAAWCLQRTSTDDAWWTRDLWADESGLRDALSLATRELPGELTRPVERLVSSASETWRACITRAVRRNPDARFHATAMRDSLAPFVSAIEAAAVSLAAWDGDSTLASTYGEPGVENAPSRETAPDAWRIWWEIQSGRYESILESLEGRHGISLAKPGGVEFEIARL